MATAREYIDHRIERFQVVRQKCLIWFFYPSIGFLIVTPIAVVFDAQRIATACAILAIAFLGIGTLRYRCPECSSTPMRKNDAEAGIDFDPTKCSICGARLKREVDT